MTAAVKANIESRPYVAHHYAGGRYAKRLTGGVDICGLFSKKRNAKSQKRARRMQPDLSFTMIQVNNFCQTIEDAENGV